MIRIEGFLCVSLATAILVSITTECRAAVPNGILVIPPENRTGKQDFDWIGEAVAEGLVQHIYGSANTVFYLHPARRYLFRTFGFSYPRSLSLPSALWIGRQAQARRVITGYFLYDKKGNILISLRVYDPDQHGQTSPSFDALWNNQHPAETFNKLSHRITAFLTESGFPVGTHNPDWPAFPPRIFEATVRSLFEQDPEQRWRELTEIVAQDPTIPYIRRHQVWTALEMKSTGGVVGEALDLWLGQWLPSGGSPSGSDLFLAASWYALNGNRKVSLQMLLELSRRYDTPALSNNIGVLLAKIGNLNDALYYFDRALRERPDNWTILWNKLQVELKKQNLEAVRSLTVPLWGIAMTPNLLKVALQASKWVPNNTISVWLERFHDEVFSESFQHEPDNETPDEPFLWIFPLNPVWPAYNMPPPEWEVYQTRTTGDNSLNSATAEDFASRIFHLLVTLHPDDGSQDESFYMAASWLLPENFIRLLKVRRLATLKRCEESRELLASIPVEARKGTLHEELMQDLKTYCPT